MSEHEIEITKSIYISGTLDRGIQRFTVRFDMPQEKALEVLHSGKELGVWSGNVKLRVRLRTGECLQTHPQEDCRDTREIEVVGDLLGLLP